MFNRHQTFIDAFKDFPDCFVIIGGTATAANLSNDGFPTHITKDYDIVVLEEGRNTPFFATLQEYLIEGKYVYSKSNDKPVLYRFKTDDPNYPPMIELLCKRAGFLENWPGPIRSLSFDEEASLSAIMLDLPYYEFILENRISFEDINYLNKNGLVVLKAKAWTYLFNDKRNGISVKSSEIDKHLEDIYKLLVSYEEITKITLNHELQKDMNVFLDNLAMNIQMIPESRDYPLKREEMLAYINILLK